MELLPIMMDLQARNTELEHKVRIATEMLKHGIDKADCFGEMDTLYRDVSVALTVLQRRGEASERRTNARELDRRT